MIAQMTVFLENEKGRLAAATRAIADAGINMHALFLADSADFGIARIFCDKPQAAAEALRDAGYRATLTDVVAVRVSNEAGGLAALLQACDNADANIEYAYCYVVNGDSAINVLKAAQPDVEEKLAAAGFQIVDAAEIYELD